MCFYAWYSTWAKATFNKLRAKVPIHLEIDSIGKTNITKTKTKRKIKDERRTHTHTHIKKRQLIAFWCLDFYRHTGRAVIQNYFQFPSILTTI